MNPSTLRDPTASGRRVYEATPEPPDSDSQSDGTAGTLIVQRGNHDQPLDTGGSAVTLQQANQRAPITTTSGRVQLQIGTMVQVCAHQGPAIRTGSGTISLHGSAVHGDLQTSSGSILVDRGSCVHGDVRYLGTTPPKAQVEAVRVEGGTVCGKVVADSVRLNQAKVHEVILDGRQRAMVGAEARLDLFGVNDVRTIRAQGPAVVVFHKAPSKHISLIGEELQCLYLDRPSNLAALEHGTSLPPSCAPLTWEYWHELQHGLEYLCAPGVHQFQTRSEVHASDWAGWRKHLMCSGHQVAHLFRGWLERQPAMLLTGMQALSDPAIERACAGLALALLRPPPFETQAQRSVLNDVIRLAATRGIRRRDVREHMDGLEGIHFHGGSLALPYGSSAGPLPASSRHPAEPLPASFVHFMDRIGATP